jgi:hypothetical protein
MISIQTPTLRDTSSQPPLPEPEQYELLTSVSRAHADEVAAQYMHDVISPQRCPPVPLSTQRFIVNSLNASYEVHQNFREM